jgi:hypothetical protein
MAANQNVGFISLARELRDMIYEAYILDAGITYELNWEDFTLSNVLKSGRGGAAVGRRVSALHNVSKIIRAEQQLMLERLVKQGAVTFHVNIPLPRLIRYRDVGCLPVEYMRHCEVFIDMTERRDTQKYRGGDILGLKGLWERMPKLKSLHVDVVNDSQNQWQARRFLSKLRTVGLYQDGPANKVGRAQAAAPLELVKLRVDGVYKVHRTKRVMPDRMEGVWALTAKEASEQGIRYYEDEGKDEYEYEEDENENDDEEEV